MRAKPVILCVDDEAPVLEGIARSQSRRYDIRTAESGAHALELLKANPGTAAVVSDMRMPEMDGATLLARIRENSPEIVRILLTGHADMDAAARAVNEGHIFRFLLKPCKPERLTEVLDDAVEMHRLLSAERVLLHQTLLGSVKAVVSILGLANPKAMGQALRVRERSRQAAREMDTQHSWGVEFAALFSQLSAAALPEDVAEKVYSGKTLSGPEQGQLIDSIKTINELLTDIPRLEPVTDTLRELIRLSEAGAVDIEQTAARIPDARLLRAVIDLDRLESNGLSPRQALDELAKKPNVYGLDALEALERGVATSKEADEATCSPRELIAGMVLAEDLNTTDGLLLLPRGFEITRNALDSLLQRFLKRLPAGIRVHTPVSRKSDD